MKLTIKIIISGIYTIILIPFLIVAAIGLLIALSARLFGINFFCDEYEDIYGNSAIVHYTPKKYDPENPYEGRLTRQEVQERNESIWGRPEPEPYSNKLKKFITKKKEL